MGIPRSDIKLTHGELFAGVSGFGLGFERAGIQTLWHVEIDTNCQHVLRRHYPDAAIHDDVCRVGAHNLPYVDIITFGSPCQDLSVAGKRAGLEGGRSGLFYEAARIIYELNPRYAIWENVPGALSSNEGRDFQAVLSELIGTRVPMPRSGRWASSGVVRSGARELAWRILDAQYFGVAQRRRRLFAVLDLGEGRAAEILFEREGVRRDTPPRRQKGQGTPPDTQTGVGSGGEELARALTSRNERIDGETETFVSVSKEEVDEDIAATLRGFGHGWQGQQNDTHAVIAPVGIDGEDVGYTLRASPSHSGDKGDGGINTSFAVDVCNLREQPDEVSGTIQAKKSGGYSLNYTNPIAVQNTVIGRSDQARPGGKGYNEETMFTLDASGDPHAVAFNIQENDNGAHKRKDRPDGGMYVKETDTSLTLGSADETVVAFSSKDNGRDAAEDLAPTLRAQNFDKSHINGGGQLAIAFSQNEREEVRELDDVSGAVSAEPGMHQQTFLAVATPWDGQRAQIHDPEGVAPTLPHGAAESGNQIPAIAYSAEVSPCRGKESYSPKKSSSGQMVDFSIAQSIGVRRLTPVECCRLQDFPDDWNEWGIDEEGKRVAMSDSTRYRQMGNAVCVAVTAWIAGRIVKVEQE